MANLVESGELVVKVGVKGGEVYFPGGWRRAKMLQETSKSFKRVQGFFGKLQETSRNFNAKTAPKRPKRR